MLTLSAMQGLNAHTNPNTKQLQWFDNTSKNRSLISWWTAKTKFLRPHGNVINLHTFKIHFKQNLHQMLFEIISYLTFLNNL